MTSLQVAGLMCFIVWASLQIKPPSKQVEPARKLLAPAIASGPMSAAFNSSGTPKQRPPLLSRKLMMIIVFVPSLAAISAAVIYLFCRRNPNSAELSDAAVPNTITYNFSIIGALFSVT